MNVCIIGASQKPDRYSYKAMMLLAEKGHRVFPVHPKLSEIEGIPVYARLADLPEPVHTITMYVGPDRSAEMADEITSIKPQRVIFNPGAENPVLSEKLAKAGIEVLEACTLVLLKTGQF
ncbi:MAG: CoA-binding protein [Candidatus Wallbacteria bacterium]|nr:CoA-binding protein [Candidatus Wallbacteria bacterium]